MATGAMMGALGDDGDDALARLDLALDDLRLSLATTSAVTGTFLDMPWDMPPNLWALCTAADGCFATAHMHEGVPPEAADMDEGVPPEAAEDGQCTYSAVFCIWGQDCTLKARIYESSWCKIPKDEEPGNAINPVKLAFCGNCLASIRNNGDGACSINAYKYGEGVWTRYPVALTPSNDGGHPITINCLAVHYHGESSFVIGGCDNGTLPIWRLDGDAEACEAETFTLKNRAIAGTSITALAIVADGGIFLGTAEAEFDIWPGDIWHKSEDQTEPSMHVQDAGCVEHICDIVALRKCGSYVEPVLTYDSFTGEFFIWNVKQRRDPPMRLEIPKDRMPLLPTFFDDKYGGGVSWRVLDFAVLNSPIAPILLIAGFRVASETQELMIYRYSYENSDFGDDPIVYVSVDEVKPKQEIQYVKWLNDDESGNHRFLTGSKVDGSIRKWILPQSDILRVQWVRRN